MYITGRDTLVQKAYREEIRRQAEPWHILRETSATAKFALAAFRGIMLQIGLWLESIGCWLKSRYGAPQVEAAFSCSPDGGLQSC